MGRVVPPFDVHRALAAKRCSDHNYALIKPRYKPLFLVYKEISFCVCINARVLIELSCLEKLINDVCVSGLYTKSEELSAKPPLAKGHNKKKCYELNKHCVNIYISGKLIWCTYLKRIHTGVYEKQIKGDFFFFGILLS